MKHNLCIFLIQYFFRRCQNFLLQFLYFLFWLEVFVELFQYFYSGCFFLNLYICITWSFKLRNSFLKTWMYDLVILVIWLLFGLEKFKTLSLLLKLQLNWYVSFKISSLFIETFFPLIALMCLNRFCFSLWITLFSH